MSKSEFIREQFTKNNLGRKEISEKFDINYRTVYGATVNLTNDAEPSTRGRSASVSKINVTADGHVVSHGKAEDGSETLLIDNEVVVLEEGQTAPETTEVDRNTWIKERVAAGVSRGDVAKVLGLSYGVVYSLTKDGEGGSQRHELEWTKEDGEKETISRSEYIRRRFAQGVERSEIAKELGVDYPVVWSALKSLKPESEKYAEAIDKLSKFAEALENADLFKSLIEQLKGFTFKPEEVPAEAEATETPEADVVPATTEEQVTE
ncbi:hypothetical protein D3C75_480980 [compost metagenome]